MSRRPAHVAAIAVIAAVVLVLAACEKSEPPPDPDRLVTQTLGRGARTTTIVRPAGLTSHVPLVMFLHGWGATDPSFYRPWIEHLARGGNAVIYPRYQDSTLTPPPQALGNLLASVRLAVDALDEDPASLVVAGHSAGGALAADYAAIAGTAGVPVPRAIFAACPGRANRGVPIGLPIVDPGRIGSGTIIATLAGSRDTVVGTAEARRIVRSATRVPRRRKHFELVEERAAADHLAPQRADAAARRAYWAPLDALITLARSRPG